jgi:hypothetical protein
MPWLVFFAACWMAVSSVAADSIESVEQAATEWARIRSEAVREEANWRWEKGLLEASLAALTERVRRLEEERDFLDTSTTNLRDSYVERGVEVQEALAVVTLGEEHCNDLSRRLIEMRPWLPPRLSQALEYAYRSLEDPTLSVGERLQTVSSVFNRCTRFNHAITYAEEMLDLDPQGAPRYVSVLYWGLSHGYALDSSDGSAFLGGPGPEGWAWEPRPEMAAQVSDLMAVFHDRATPEFIAVPVRLQNPLNGVEGTVDD